MNAKNLVGAWTLESFVLEDQDGIRKPWGEGTRGLLIYTDSNQMSVGINKNSEPSADGEAQDTLDAMLFYSGRYSIENEVVKHQVEVASDPERVGKELVRYAKLNGDTLELTSSPQSFGRSILVWKKV